MMFIHWALYCTNVCLDVCLPGVGEYQALNTLNEAIPPAIDDLILNCLFARK
jgi:hypothetical protein